MKAVKTLPLIVATICMFSCTSEGQELPYWLSDYEDVNKGDSLEASRQWFKDAKMGMFVHFNLASLMELGSIDYKLWTEGEADERVLNHVGISRDEYINATSKEGLLYTKFEIPEFDAEKICQLAIKANMKYITFTAHHFTVNFDSEYLPLNSADSSPAKRDLVGEMIAACKKYKLAPFLYMRGDYKTAKSSNGEEAYFWLTYARYTGSNLLMSIGPRKDGSIHPDAEKGLVELGQIIEERGWPEVVHEIPKRPEE